MNRPTREDIDQQLDIAMKQVDAGGSLFPGMSYEEGVNNTLSWMLGDYSDPPLDPVEVATIREGR